MCTWNVIHAKRKGNGAFALATLIFLGAGTGFALGDIISSDRLIDWSGAGTSIPSASWPIFTTVSPGGSIQNAVNSCPVGQVVLLAAGTYNLTSRVTINKGIVIRGASPDTTIINFTGTIPAFNFGPYDAGAYPTDPDFSAGLTGGYTKGSMTLTVNLTGLSAPALAALVVGREIEIDQINDGSLVNANGSEGLCTYCSRENGNRSMCQRNVITAKSVNGSTATITLQDPMYFTYTSSLTPQIAWFSADTVKNAGIEDLKVINNGSDQGVVNYTVQLAYCTNSWVRNIRTERGSRAHIDFYACYHCTLTHTYFTLSKSSASLSYGLEIGGTSSANLVFDNIFYQTTGPIVGGWTLAGNVFAYNFINQVIYSPQTWLPECITFHDAHAMFNLVEGNISPELYADFIHGSASHNTIFRNRLYGFQTVGGVNSSSDTIPIVAEAHNRFFNVVGNVLGTTGYHTHYEELAPASINETSIYKLGYFGTYDTSNPDSQTYLTMLRHGNWDTFSNAIVWDPGITDHTIVDSYYLPSKPTWFGNLPWPPIDPASPGSITSTSIPAGYRFVNGTDPPGPTPTPTPTSTPTPSTTPEPPDGLRVRGF